MRKPTPAEFATLTSQLDQNLAGGVEWLQQADEDDIALIAKSIESEQERSCPHCKVMANLAALGMALVCQKAFERDRDD